MKHECSSLLPVPKGGYKVVLFVLRSKPLLQGMCDDEVSVEQFCRRYVEPMGEESDHVHIVALTNALLVSTQFLTI
jgi:hypothetical protein